MYPRILKEVAKEIGKPSSKVFDRPLRSVVIPKDLKGTKAIPRDKNQGKIQGTNPLSLISAERKILKILLRDYVEVILMYNLMQVTGKIMKNPHDILACYGSSRPQ